MGMRVTNTSVYRNHSQAVNDIHLRLNKSMSKVETGKAYESAADNPLAYYSGKRIDTQYQDTLTKSELISDIQNRVYQQELGARNIQNLLASGEANALQQIEYVLNDTNNATSTTVGTIREDLYQKVQAMVDNLNSKYENAFVYGGVDLTNTPYELKYDSSKNEMSFIYHHQFGDDVSTRTDFTIKLKYDDGTGDFTAELMPASDGADMSDALVRAMQEQGRVDVGYGNIAERSSLLDTYLGGLNLLTGIEAGSSFTIGDVLDRFKDSAAGLLSQSVIALDKYKDYIESGTGPVDHAAMKTAMTSVLNKVDKASSTLGQVYGRMGNKYELLETTRNKLDDQKLSLEEQYQDKLGVDMYDAITQMYADQLSYNAALQVSSNLMQQSLFDFLK